MTNIPLDKIFSDPLLSAGAALFLLGPIIFLFALVKFMRAGKQPVRRQSNFVVPNHPTRPSHPLPPKPEAPEPSIGVPEPTAKKEEAPPPPSSLAHTVEPKTEKPDRSDRTVALSPEFSDLQGQIEICMTQIKSVNKKLFEMERAVELLEKHQSVDLSGSDFSATPENPQDYMKKILKLAEHVIVLEKGFDDLKKARRPVPAAAPKPPAQGTPKREEPPEQGPPMPL